MQGSQIKWVYDLVTEGDPRQLKLSFALWKKALVAKAIKDKFGIKLSESSVGRLLRQLGHSNQKPLYRAYKKNPEAIEKWKKEVLFSRKYRKKPRRLAPPSIFKMNREFDRSKKDHDNEIQKAKILQHPEPDSNSGSKKPYA